MARIFKRVEGQSFIDNPKNKIKTKIWKRAYSARTLAGKVF